MKTLVTKSEVPTNAIFRHADDNDSSNIWANCAVLIIDDAAKLEVCKLIEAYKAAKAVNHQIEKVGYYTHQFSVYLLKLDEDEIDLSSVTSKLYGNMETCFVKMDELELKPYDCSSEGLSNDEVMVTNEGRYIQFTQRTDEGGIEAWATFEIAMIEQALVNSEKPTT